jgi:hypothetical protein
VKDCPQLADATGIHSRKPLDGLSFVNVTGNCVKGITMANVRNAEIRDIRVTGVSGAMVGVNNVTGVGLEGAAMIDPPKIPDPVPPAAPYQLH